MEIGAIVGGGVDVAPGNGLFVGIGIGPVVGLALGDGLLVDVGIGMEISAERGVTVLEGVEESAGCWGEMAPTIRKIRTETVASASISGVAVAIGSAVATAAGATASMLRWGVAWQPASESRTTTVIAPQERPRM